MGQFFIPRSRKFVNWNSPVFLKRYFFICSTYTSNKCFIITSNNFKKKIKPWSTIFYTPFYKTPLKWIPRSESGASKSRPRWAAGTCIGNVWEYLPRGLFPGIFPQEARNEAECTAPEPGEKEKWIFNSQSKMSPLILLLTAVTF